MGLFDDLGGGGAAVFNPAMMAGMGGQVAGQYMANQSNEKIASDMANRNQSNAREQMAFQERMSNTAHQREIQDLKAAGLNPILSAGGSGASTPSGASSSGSPATMGNIFADVPSNVMQMIKTSADVDYTRAQTKKTNVDAEVAKKGIPGSEIRNSVFDVFRPWLNKIKEAATSAAKPQYDPPLKYNKATGRYTKGVLP